MLLSQAVDVRGTWEGDVMPGTQQDLLREVVVQPNTQVRGAIFGKNVELRGACQVMRSVYAAGDVIIRLDQGPVVLESAVGARANIVCSGQGTATLRVQGNILAQRVTLTRAFVAGGISADEVVLTDCVVLGPVVSTVSVRAERCTLLTVASERVELGAAVRLVLPFAAAVTLAAAEAVPVVALDPNVVQLRRGVDTEQRGRSELLSAGSGGPRWRTSPRRRARSVRRCSSAWPAARWPAPRRCSLTHGCCQQS